MQMRIYLAAGLLGAGAPLALADVTTLEIDVNALSAQASGPLSEDFTGTLQLFNTAQNTDANAQILDLLIDGARQNTPGASNDEFSLTLDLTFDSGSITDGLLSLQIDQDASENTYIALPLPVTDGSIIDIGGNFAVGGQTFDGTFNDALGTLLGVDISPWGSAEPVEGHFAILGLQPDGQGFDSNADLDIFMVTPAPSGLAALGMGMMLLSRRRR